MTPRDTLAALQAWREEGGLRPLALALARFLNEADPAAPASLLLAAALLAQLEADGHGSLPLQGLGARAAALGLPAALGAWLPPDAEAAHAAWAGTPLLQVEPSAAVPASPLVLAAGHLYLRRYWHHEARIAAQVRARSQPFEFTPPQAAHARGLLQQLFGPPTPPGLVNWQRAACALGLRGRFTVITGGPGTGKTYTAARLLAAAQALNAGGPPLRLGLAAPTGKAASRLRQSIDAAWQGLRAQQPALGQVLDAAGPLPAALTLHSLLGVRPDTRRPRFHAAHPLELDLLLVDEASMVHLEMMSALLDALPPTARLVLLGDPDQLASVEAGAVLADVCQAAGSGYAAGTVQAVQALSGEALPHRPGGSALAQQVVALRTSQRFSGAISALAQAVNAGDAAAATTLLREGGQGTLALHTGAQAQAVPALAAGAAGFQACLQALAQRPAEREAFEPWARSVLRAFEGFRVLCALREGPWGVAGLNTAIERALAAAGLLQPRGEWYEGRPVMVLRNEPLLKVFNGDIGLVLAAPGSGALRAWFLNGEALHSVPVARLAEVQTAFAMTVHKAQGSEFGHVALVLPPDDAPVLTRELVYTGITRARQAFTLVAPEAQRLAGALARMTERLSGLRTQLQADPDPP